MVFPNLINCGRRKNSQIPLLILTTLDLLERTTIAFIISANLWCYISNKYLSCVWSEGKSKGLRKGEDDRMSNRVYLRS